MSEKAYKHSIEKGIELLKRTIQEKNAKKKISLGTKSTEQLKKAISIAPQIRISKKIPFIFEYLQQIQATLGASYLELKKIPEAIQVFQEALESNSKTPQNTKQQEIHSFILAELAKLYSNIQKIDMAERYASQSLQLGINKNFNQEDLLDLYIELNPIFIQSGNLKRITKNYHIMVKLAKRDKRKHLKAQVYFTYGKFLHGIEKDDIESLKYLNKAQSLFESLKIIQGMTEVKKFIEENLQKDNKETSESADINRT